MFHVSLPHQNETYLLLQPEALEDVHHPHQVSPRLLCHKAYQQMLPLVRLVHLFQVLGHPLGSLSSSIGILMLTRDQESHLLH